MLLFALVSASFLLVMYVGALLIPPVLLTIAFLVEIHHFREPSRRRYFVPVALLTVLLVYGVPGAWHWYELSSKKSKYPLVSMEGSVPEPQAFYHPQQLPAETGDHLKRMEEEFRYGGGSLRRLHEETFQTFINSPGFGVARRLRPIPPLGDSSVVPQAGHRSPVLELPSSAETPAGASFSDLWFLNDLSILDFLNPRGLGYVNSRREVAGFRPHEFRNSPTAANPWTLQTVELVSLLIHEHPAVYVSPNLPRMSELRGGPTRPLDKFEERGLAELLRGEDLYIREIDGTCYMLGAIRAVKQCQTCHGCERGDLLGAFSYSLYRENAGNP
ncbi:MAG TPA: hypothetical protein VKS79_23990 [Gemmataceae bacterium]|nr:hypothetical protein [Gemmataceae bacterium]